MAVVDAHLHLFKALSDDYPRAIFEGMTPPDREELAEELLAAMEIAGVDRAVVVALSPHDEYLAEVLRDHPGRFAGVGVLDFAEEDPVSDLKRRVETTGMQGLRLYGLDAEPGSDPESIRVFPLLEAMAEMEVKAWFYGPPDQVEILDGVMALLPELKVVLNHLGFCPDMHMELRIDEDRRPRFDDIDLPPDSLPLVERLAGRHDNLFVQLSGAYAFTSEAYPYRDVQPVVDRVYAAFGANRMLLASDWPWIKVNPGYRETLALVDSFLPDLPEDERAWIRGGTAESLFSF